MFCRWRSSTYNLLLSANLYTVGLVVLQVIVNLFQLHLGFFIPEGHRKV